MEQLIKSADHLKQFFIELRRVKEAQVRGVLVSSNVRREFMLGSDQGKMVLNGTVQAIHFEPMGGGIYRAYIQPGPVGVC